jgi:integrase
MAMLQLLRSLRGTGVTVHGFRSSLRDWCGEQGVDREVAEAALAHVVQNKAEAAYARSDLLERRRPVMEAWAGHCTSGGAAAICVRADSR